VGLLYLSGILYDSGETDIKVIDAVAEGVSWKEVQDRIRLLNPDIMLVATGTASYPEDLGGIAGIDGKERIRIYLLGNMPAFEPEYFLTAYPYIRGIIHNFMDSSLKDFLLRRKTSCKSVSYRTGDGIQRGEINIFRNMQEIQLPHVPLYGLFPLARYATPLMQRSPMVTVLTSFGCPFRCGFCVASSLNFQPRRASDMKKEFDAIKKNGIREIFFEDSTFNNTRMESICRMLIKYRYGFSWSANIHNFNSSVKTLQLMKQAGCHTVQLGIESGSPDILKTYAPSKEVMKIKTAVHNCRKAGLKVLGYFIIGFPEETPLMAEKTLRLAEELDLDYASFSVLTPDYGTEMRKRAIEKKMMKTEDVSSFDSSGRAVLRNEHFSEKEQERMIALAYRRFYLHPKRLMRYVLDVKRLPLYIKNGAALFLKKII